MSNYEEDKNPDAIGCAVFLLIMLLIIPIILRAVGWISYSYVDFVISW